MNRAVEKIKSSSLLAIVALSLGVLWSGALLVYYVGQAFALPAAPTVLETLAATDFQPIRRIAVTLLLFAIAGVSLSVFVTIRAHGSPFLPQVYRRMKLLALLVFLLSEAPNWVVYGLRILLLDLWNFTVISGSGFVGLTLAAALYAFAMIFRYGCLLQQESDETL